MGSVTNAAINKITILTDTTFKRWNLEIEAALKSQDLYKFVASSCNTNSLIGTLGDSKEMYRAVSLIYSTLDDDNLQRVVNCNTAFEIYKKLIDYHSGSSTTSIEKLMQRFHAIKYNDDLKDVFSQIRSVASELSVKKKILSDSEMCAKLLAILPDKYESILNSVEAIRLSSGSSLTFDQLEILIKGSITTKNDGDEISKNVLGGMTKRKKANVVCYKCHKKGHYMIKCPMNGPKKETKVALSALKVKNNFSGRTNVLPEPSRDAYEYCEVFADGGASHHTFNDKRYFIDLHPCGVNEIISPGGNTRATAIGTVEIEVNNGKRWITVSLSNSLLIEKSPMNMISLGQLSKHRNISFGGDFRSTVIYRNGDPLIYADRSSKYSNVYMVRARLPRKRSVALMACHNSMSLWHERFNHVNAQTIVSMANKDLVIGLPSNFNQDLDYCTPCHKGKMIESCHSKSSKRFKVKPGDFIHLDIGGYVREKSIHNNRYFLLCVDDLSGYIKIYFMKDRSETFTKFKRLMNEVALETGNQIRCIRSDCGSEFTSNKFKELVDNHGIVHQFATVGVP